MATSDKDLFVDYIEKINNTWISGKTDELYNYFSNDVVFASPSSQRYLQGKEVCIRSYKEFIKRAKIQKFKTSQYNTDLFDDVAVTTYKFDITYQTENKLYEESGYEIMVFKKFSEDWLVIWRTQMKKEHE